MGAGRFDGSLGIQTRYPGLCGVQKAHQHLHLAGNFVGTGVNPGHLAAKGLTRVPIDPKTDRLAHRHRTDLVGRHPPGKPHAGGVYDLEQLLADGRRVASGYFALAHHTIKRRTHQGAFQLLSGQHGPGLRGRQLAGRAVAAHFCVIKRLQRGHAGGTQGFEALQVAFGLVQRLRCVASVVLRRLQVVPDGGGVQARQHIAPADDVAVVFEHL